MKAAVMQPYFLPYIGYFQLMAVADQFVVYDDIQYTKRGWINRNRYLRDGRAATFTLPLKGASDYLDVCERSLADDFDADKLLNQLRTAYRSAPHFREISALLEEILHFEDRNLFHFLHHSIRVVCALLEIGTPIRVSSTLDIDPALHKQERVLAICHSLRATTYINAIGGVDLYTRETFEAAGVKLHFLRSMPREYPQFGRDFIPQLSILDLLMFNPVSVVRAFVRADFELI